MKKGVVTYINKALKSSGLEVNTIRNLKQNNFAAFIKGAVYGRIINKTYFKDLESGMLKSYAAQTKKALGSIDYDVAFSPTVDPIAYIATISSDLCHQNKIMNNSHCLLSTNISKG
jgi:hypothetical protein